MNAALFAMRREVREEHFGTVVIVDTIAHIRPEDSGRIVVAGSHGGISSGEYASAVSAALVVFNDAGGGKDDAGRAALPYLDQKGIAAGTVAHDSAMIGDALDAWENGIVSAVNERARCAGLSTGRLLRECLPEMLRS